MLTPAELSALVATRTNFALTLAAESVNPRPSYTIGSQTVDFPSWATFMRTEIEALDLMIQQQQDNRGAWEVRSRGLP